MTFWSLLFVVTFETPNENSFRKNFISLRHEKRRKFIEMSYNGSGLLWVIVDFNSKLAFELYPQQLFYSGNGRNG
jgi:hypothetical protein